MTAADRGRRGRVGGYGRVMSETDKPAGDPDTNTDTDDNIVDAEIVEESTELGPVSPGVPTTSLEPDYTEGGVPTFDYVRDKIEGRSTTAAGATELAGLGTDNTVADWDKKLEERNKAGADKLEEIRRQMRGE